MTQRPVFLYDGDCAFCSACAQIIERFMTTPAEVKPWQWADIDALGLTVEQCDSAVQWVRPGVPTRAGPEAIAELLLSARGWLGFWKLAGAVLRLPPVRWVAWPVYRWIARNRDRMPGGTAACALPQAQRGTGTGPAGA